MKRYLILINNVSSKKSSKKLSEQKFEDWITDMKEFIIRNESFREHEA